MFTQPRDQITKINLRIKFFALIVTKQIIPSEPVSRKNEMMKTKEKRMLDQNLLKTYLYNTFVLHPMIEQNDMINDIEAEVHYEIFLITEITIPKTDTALHLEIVLVMTKALILYSSLVHDMTIKKETRDLIALPIVSHTNLLIDVTSVTDIDHIHFLQIIILHDKHPPLDHLRDQEILGFPDLAHTQVHELNLIQSNHKLKMIQITLKYICITQLKWQTL